MEKIDTKLFHKDLTGDFSKRILANSFSRKYTPAICVPLNSTVNTVGKHCALLGIDCVDRFNSSNANY